MKPRDQWGPADEAVDGISKGFALALVLFFGAGFGLVAVSAENDLITPNDPYQGFPAKAGFIGCDHGAFTVRNIIFYDLPKDWHINVPEDPHCPTEKP